tara:strand:- start:5165 stop:5326 length:162 start_codon:yes stop_codon:yes gene_type:complete
MTAMDPLPRWDRAMVYSNRSMHSDQFGNVVNVSAIRQKILLLSGPPIAELMQD